MNTVYPQGPVVEHAGITVKPGQEEAFERAVADARPIFAQARGFRSLELARAVEDPARYVVLVGWETVEDHTVNFKEDGLWQQWRDLAAEHFAGPPEVHHYVAVDGV